MPPSNVVVDGSNIATEGRTTPSLEQLDQAVRQYLQEHPGSNVTVVVDASFGHRIEPSERAAFEQAVAHGELVSPPAGAIGRGDAFLLRIAERIGARVLSNDSFREFHAEHPWLFDEDRLVGGTPVPSVGWIFTPRRPVRGPLTPAAAGTGRRGSRQEGESEQTEDGAESGEPAEAPKPKSSRSRGSRRGKPAPDRKVQDAIAEATEEALTPGEGKQKRGKPKPKSEAAPEAVNDPLPFITFASEHPVGSELQGTVVSFTSHGAMAQVEDMLCYVPLAGLGDPPPRRARDVLHQGEIRTFELVALDPARRGAQLALPEVVAVHGEIAEGAEEAASEVRGRRRRHSTSSRSVTDKAAPNEVEPTDVVQKVQRSSAAPKAPKQPPSRSKTPAKRSAHTEVGTQATRARGAKSAERAKKAEPARSAPAAKKVPTKRASTKKAAPAKVATPRKTTPRETKLPRETTVSAKKALAGKNAAPVGGADSAKAAPVRKARATGKVSAARKVPASDKSSSRTSKSPLGAQGAGTKKAGTKKAGASKAVVTKAGANKTKAGGNPTKN